MGNAPERIMLPRGLPNCSIYWFLSLPISTASKKSITKCGFLPIGGDQLVKT